MSGILYTVATPIGNLEDITPRALKILEKVDYILCEDTRVSSKLLSHFEIKNKLYAYHKFNEKEQLNKVVEDLKSGKNIALISDAGTPCISDPGRVLVNELFEQNIKVCPISGACAISTLLSAVPKAEEAYTFAGFAPRTPKEQKEFFDKYSKTDLIFYESPNRLTKTLENIISFYGENTRISIGRELTKLHEEILSDTAKNLLEKFTQTPPKGEIAVVLYKTQTEALSEEESVLKAKAEALKVKGYSTKDISVILSTVFDINKNTVYKLVNNI